MNTERIRPPHDYIVFPLDLPSAAEAWPLVDALEGAVGMFKIGLELFVREGPAVVELLRRRTGAKIFLDLKLHDIPATVERATRAVADLGVNFVTVHCVDSHAMLEAAVRGAAGHTALLGVTVLTSVGPEDLRRAGLRQELADAPERLVLTRAAMAAAAGCAGVVCSPRELNPLRDRFGHRLLAVTPGVRPTNVRVGADDQKRVATPADAICSGADYLVIGRPIRDAPDPRRAAEAVAGEIAQGLAALRVGRPYQGNTK